MNFFNVLQYVIICYFAFSIIYVLIFSFASLFSYKLKNKLSGTYRKIAVLIPSYKEDSVILETAKDALHQNYPTEYFDIIIIADKLADNSIASLKQLPIKLIEVNFEISTKSKALNKAMEILPNNYDLAVILDADNLMEKDFLSKINNAFNNNYVAVQGHRIAKNANTSFAILDAISEEINNNIFRKGHRVLGFSSALIGSAIAIDYQIFKKLMKSAKSVGGFDKEIELKLLKERYVIEYLEDAYVYDEKVQKSDVFVNQRRRWLSAQFYYFGQDFPKAVWHLITKGNYDYFDKALQFIQLPRILLLGLLFIFCILSLLFNPVYLSICWSVMFVGCIFVFIFSIPIKFYNYKTLLSLWSLPKGFFLMLFSLFRSIGANKNFIHTEHSNNKPIKNIK